MFRISTICLVAVLSLAMTATGNAQHRRGHHLRGLTMSTPIVCNEFGCLDQAKVDPGKRAHVLNANKNTVVGRRPAGCPHAYCGCEASLYLFKKIRPKLNLAANWLREFPRTAPAPGMVAARTHHVMVLMRHVSGSRWLVHDGNSGGGLTREHVMSIRGYTIVDPHGLRLARQEQ